MGVPGRDCYTAAKGGIAAITRSLARAYAPQKVRVNAIAPSATMTERVKRLVAGNAALTKLAVLAPARADRTGRHRSHGALPRQRLLPHGDRPGAAGRQWRDDLMTNLVVPLFDIARRLPDRPAVSDDRSSMDLPRAGQARRAAGQRAAQSGPRAGGPRAAVARKLRRVCRALVRVLGCGAVRGADERAPTPPRSNSSPKIPVPA